MSVFGLEHQARALSNVQGELDRNRWLVGTLGPFGSENKIHLIDFDEDSESITSTCYVHPYETWSIASSPSNRKLFLTCHSSVGSAGISHGSTLWEIPDIEDGALTQAYGSLETVASLSEKVHQMHWDPAGTDVILGLGDATAQLFTLNSTKITSLSRYQSQDMGLTHCASWNPHDTKQIAIGLGQSIVEWDTRTQNGGNIISKAHEIAVRDIDYNPNKPYQLISCGDDCQVRIWDMRNQKVSMQFSDHTHWIWNVRYNRSHDQLVLTSSSDCQVNLQSVISQSSVPVFSNELETDRVNAEEEEKPVDGLVCAYDKHEESVYGLAWSSADPWLFASLSYDGRVLVHFVPREHKYKIIL